MPLALFLPNDPAQQPSMKRGPRDHSKPEVHCSREHLKFHGALDQIVDRLLGDQAGVVALVRGGLGLCNVPARKVRTAGVEDLALLHRHFHRLPDLIPRGAAVDVVKLIEVSTLSNCFSVHAPGENHKSEEAAPRGAYGDNFDTLKSFVACTADNLSYSVALGHLGPAGFLKYTYIVAWIGAEVHNMYLVHGSGFLSHLGSCVAQGQSLIRTCGLLTRGMPAVSRSSERNCRDPKWRRRNGLYLWICAACEGNLLLAEVARDQIDCFIK